MQRLTALGIDPATCVAYYPRANAAAKLVECEVDPAIDPYALPLIVIMENLDQLR